MKRLCSVLACALLLLCGCARKSQPKTTLDLRIINESTQTTAHCWVNGGRGPLDFGFLIPKAAKDHGDFPAVVGAQLNVRWQFENDSKTREAADLLGRGIQPKEKVTIILTAETATVSK